jgi:hypothetical protein
MSPNKLAWSAISTGGMVERNITEQRAWYLMITHPGDIQILKGKTVMAERSTYRYIKVEEGELS